MLPQKSFRNLNRALDTTAIELIPLSMGCLGSHMRRDLGLLALLSRDDVLFCERIDQVFKVLALIVRDFVTVDAADRILEHNACDHAGLHLSVLLKVGFRVIQEVVEGLRPRMRAQDAAVEWACSQGSLTPEQRR